MDADAAAEPAALGVLLRAQRVRAGLTQEELAERTGAAVSARTLRRIESGQTRPYRPTLEALATALALDPPARRQLLAAWRAHPGATQRLAPGVAPSSVSAAPLLDRVPLTPLLGREREVAVLAALLERGAVRLLTLTGPGGVGKTRVALHVAQAQAARYRDGVVAVDLAPLRDPALVLPTLAQALGLRDAGPAPLPARLQAYLRPRELLVVLDNVEQVVAAAPQLADLLATCPRLTLLATSRLPLRVRGEQEVAVPSLALPPADATATPDTTDAPAGAPSAALAALAQVPAVALLVQRAQAVRPDFALTATNAAAVAALCRRLDGLPLALELAAVHLKRLSPATLLSFLEQRLDLLTGGLRDLPARQRSLQATLDWSDALLSPPAQALLHQLGVVAGGCTLEAAAALVGAEPHPAPPPALHDCGRELATPAVLAAPVLEALTEHTSP